MIINYQDFKKVVSMVVGGIATKDSHYKPLKAVKLSFCDNKLTAVATDSSILLQGSVDIDSDNDSFNGVVLVDGKTLLNAIKSVKTKLAIKLTIDSDTLTIASENNKAIIPLLKDINYPDLTFILNKAYDTNTDNYVTLPIDTLKKFLSGFSDYATLTFYIEDKHKPITVKHKDTFVGVICPIRE